MIFDANHLQAHPAVNHIRRWHTSSSRTMASKRRCRIQPKANLIGVECFVAGFAACDDAADRLILPALG
jgi:hypothetical protein